MYPFKNKKKPVKNSLFDTKMNVIDLRYDHL